VWQEAFADVVRDEVHRPPGCGVVGIHEPTRSERPVQHGGVADHRGPDAVDPAHRGQTDGVGDGFTATDHRRGRGALHRANYWVLSGVLLPASATTSWARECTSSLA